MGFAFEYDSRKAASNLKKHGVSFREAMTVFDDPMAQTFPDDLHSEDESRSITIGLSSRHSLYIRLSLVSMRPEIQSAAGLRRELSARNLARAETVAHEATYGAVPSVLYAEDEAGGHGNFLAASYKRICADPQWRLRLEKSYTANARVPRAGDRRRKELDCCASSDALLMNIFCTPRVMARPELCALLGVEAGLRPEFGVRAMLAMRRGEVDRTELDMRVSTGTSGLLFEAKLTETGFQTASMERVMRYEGVAEIFEVDELPRAGERVVGYQLVRGVLAAQASGGRFVLLCDGRRADLQEMWFRVMRAVGSFDLRSRMAVLSWQEVARSLPPVLRGFLAEKYGIVAAR